MVIQNHHSYWESAEPDSERRFKLNIDHDGLLSELIIVFALSSPQCHCSKQFVLGTPGHQRRRDRCSSLSCI